MGIALQLAAALIITALLVYLSSRRSYTMGFLDGLSAGRKESAQLSYHQGHDEGLYEGRLKERLEWETRAYKGKRDYDAGYNDALAAVAGMSYTAMLSEAETKLSA